jgi:hypothetical protein
VSQLAEATSDELAGVDGHRVAVVSGQHHCVVAEREDSFVQRPEEGPSEGLGLVGEVRSTNALEKRVSPVKRADDPRRYIVDPSVWPGVVIADTVRATPSARTTSKPSVRAVNS